MRIAILAASSLALALAACGDTSDTKAASSPEEIEAAMADTKTMRPGQYEAEVEFLEFDVPGMPAAAIEQARAEMAKQTATKRSYCLTEAEAERSQQDRLREMGNAQGDCSFTRFTVDGENVDSALRCTGMPGNASATITMAGTMGDEGSDVNVSTSLSNPAVPAASASVKMRVQTRRVGECTAASRAEAEAAAAADRSAAPAAPAR